MPGVGKQNRDGITGLVVKQRAQEHLWKQDVMLGIILFGTLENVWKRLSNTAMYCSLKR